MLSLSKKKYIFSNDEKTWKNKNDILWYENRLYLLETLRVDVIKHNHNDSLIDHFDTKKTLKLIQKKYYWFNQNDDENFEMKHQIKKYCETCAICKRNKFFKHKSYEKLSSFFIFEYKWIDINMNFVTKLFKNKT